MKLEEINKIAEMLRESDEKGVLLAGRNHKKGVDTVLLTSDLFKKVFDDYETSENYLDGYKHYVAEVSGIEYTALERIGRNEH